MLKNLLLIAFCLAGSCLFAAPAPDFTITDSDGHVRKLYADFVNQGKVVVLEVFFVNCPPCATYAPFWQTLYQSTQSQHPGQVEFLMLSDKNADLNAAVAQYKIAKGLTMPAAGSNGGSLPAVQPYEAGQFGLFYGTPTYIVIKPGTGEVVFDVRGDDPPTTMDLIRQNIDQLLLPECRILNYKGDTLQQYAMNVAVPGGVSANFQVTNGTYSLENFTGLPSIPFYLATPSKKDNPLNGVSTFDLVQINKQILGLEPFTQPWQFVAADANGSGTITTFDIVEFRKLILGVYDTLPSAPSWVFSPTVDTISPLSCADFLAIKKGDVNGNANPAGATGKSEDRGGSPVPLLLDNPFAKAGDTYRLLLRAGRSGRWLGLQAAWQIDPTALQVLRVDAPTLPGFDREAWLAQEGRLSVSWFNGDPVDVAGDAPLLVIEVRALRDGYIGSVMTLETTPLRPEIYDADGNCCPLEPRTFALPAGATALWPNPSNGYFALQIEESGRSNTVLQIIDVQGKSVWEQAVTLVSGTNVIDVYPGHLPAGVYAVRVGGRFAGKLTSP